MQSFRELIDLIGVGPLSEMIGAERRHVHTMRARNSIPPEFWCALIDKAPEGLRGAVTFEVLQKLREAGRMKRRSGGAG